MLKLIEAICPYPFTYKGVLYNGYLLTQSNFCRKCNEKFCLKKSDNSNNFVCGNGFACFVMEFGNEYFIVNGLISQEISPNFDGTRRKAYKKYKIYPAGIAQLKNTLSKVGDFVALTASEHVKGSVAFLHDIRTSVGIVLDWCQKIISKQQGSSFEEQLERVDIETANLFGAINLLKEQLDLADIIANPASVTYGKKHKSAIHGFILKMIKLFEPRAEKKGNNIWLYGSTYAKIEAYNSFQFIPLILLDNAVKYSFPGSEIKIELFEQPDHVILRVKSYGKLVTEEYRDKIFQRYVRDPQARKNNPHGMGLGLYTARMIAKAHGTDITYSIDTQSGDEGYNQFSISVKKA